MRRTILLVALLVLCCAAGVWSQINIQIPAIPAAPKNVTENLLKYTITPFRQFVMQPQMQMAGNPTKLLAASVQSTIFKGLKNIQRYLIYDYDTKVTKGAPTTSNLVVPSNMSSYTDLVSPGVNYVQGVAFYIFFGIACLLITLFLSLFTVAVCIYSKICCLCVPCRSCRAVPADKRTGLWCCFVLSYEDKKLQRQKPRTWFVCTSTKFTVRLVLLVFLALFMLFFLAGVIILDVFYYQVNLDVSTTIDTMGAMFSNTISSLNSLLSFVDTAVPATIGGLNATVISYFDSTLTPLLSTVTSIPACINGLFNLVPNTTVISGFVDTLYSQKDYAVSLIGLIQGNITSLNSTLQVGVVGGVASVAVAVNQAISDLNSTSAMSTAITNVEGARTSFLSSGSAALNTTLSQLTIVNNANLSSILAVARTSMQNLGNAETVQTKINNLNSAKSAINSLKISFGVFKSDLTNLKNVIQNSNLGPTTSVLQSDLTGANNAYTNQSLSAIGTALRTTETQINSLTTYITNTQNVANQILATLNNLPSFSIVTNETGKIALLKTQATCLVSVASALNNISQSVLQFPQNYLNQINSIGNLTNVLNGFDSTSITNTISNLNSTISGFVPILNEQFSRLNFTSMTSQFPNLTSIIRNIDNATSSLTSSIQQVEAQGVSWTALYSGLYNFTSSIQNLINAQITNTINSLDTSITNFNVANSIDPALNKLALETPLSNPCNSGCQTNVQNEASTFLSNTATLKSNSDAFEALNTAYRLQLANANVNNAGWSTFSPAASTQISALNNVYSNAKDGLSSTSSTINSMQSTVQSAIGAVPIGTISSSISSFSGNLNVIPAKSSITGILSTVDGALSGFDRSSVNSLISTINSVSSNLNIGAQVSNALGGLSTTISSYTGLVAPLNTTLNDISEYYNTIFPAIIGFDGYRILLCGLVIFIITLPLLLIGFLPLCLPKQPCALLILAFVCMFFAYLSNLIVVIGLPANILFADNCPNLETIVTNSLSLIPSDIRTALHIQQSVSLGSASISLDINGIDTVKKYLTSCDGSDDITKTVNQFRTGLGTIIVNVVQSTASSALPAGFALQQAFLTQLNTTFANTLVQSLNNNLFNSMNSYIGCSAINTKYLELKTLPCTTVYDIISNIWVLAFIFGILWNLGMFVFTFIYLGLLIVWTRNYLGVIGSKRNVKNVDVPNRQQNVPTGTEMQTVVIHVGGGNVKTSTR